MGGRDVNSLQKQMSVPSIPQGNSAAVDLFAVSDTVWTPISKRVGLTVLAGGEVAGLVKYLPHLPDMETACQAWVNTTFPGMVSLSTDIASFATAAAVRFAQLNYSIAQAAPAGAVSKSAADPVIAALAVLAQQAAPLIAQCKALETQIQSFSTANLAADQTYHMYYWIIGQNWPAPGNSIPMVAAAAGSTAAGWTALVDQFNAVTSGGIQSMQSTLLSSELQQAIQSWTVIAAAASAFDLTALAQQQYLSGAWLNS
jgi:hypothetical protein